MGFQTNVTLILASLVAVQESRAACEATFQASFDQNNGVVVESSKDLSHVILELCNGTTYKFDNLNIGHSGYFTLGSSIRSATAKAGCSLEKFEQECNVVATPTATPTGTSSPTSIPTSEPTIVPTTASTPTIVPTNTIEPTSTATVEPSATPEAPDPTATATATGVPSDTPVATSTSTSVPVETIEPTIVVPAATDTPEPVDTVGHMPVPPVSTVSPEPTQMFHDVVCELVPVETDKQEIIRQAARLLYKATKYYAKSRDCGLRSWKYYVSKARLEFRLLKLALSGISDVVVVCDGKCTDPVMKAVLKDLQYRAENISRHARLSQYMARGVCATKGKGLKKTQAEILKLQESVEHCLSNRC